MIVLFSVFCGGQLGSTAPLVWIRKKTQTSRCPHSHVGHAAEIPTWTYDPVMTLPDDDDDKWLSWKAAPPLPSLTHDQTPEQPSDQCAWL